MSTKAQVIFLVVMLVVIWNTSLSLDGSVPAEAVNCLENVTNEAVAIERCLSGYLSGNTVILTQPRVYSLRFGGSKCLKLGEKFPPGSEGSVNPRRETIYYAVNGRAFKATEQGMLQEVRPQREQHKPC